MISEKQMQISMDARKVTFLALPMIIISFYEWPLWTIPLAWVLSMFLLVFLLQHVTVKVARNDEIRLAATMSVLYGAYALTAIFLGTFGFELLAALLSSIGLYVHSDIIFKSGMRVPRI